MRRAAQAAVPEISWTSVAGETLSARVAAQIRGALFSDQIKAGDRLGSESALAVRFGVSRMAMRDALRSLAAIGIVDVRIGAKGGVFIAHGNPERFADALTIQLKLIGLTIEELFDAQIAIEVTSAELAAQRSTDADREKLHGLVGELETFIKSGLRRSEETRFTATSMRFHEALVEASQNRALVAQFKALRFVLEPVYLELTTSEVVDRVVASHKAVLACIEQRDGEGARVLMQRRLHVIRTRHLEMQKGLKGSTSLARNRKVRTCL